MTSADAKEAIKQLGLSGVQFSELMGFYKNRVTDFTRTGVPDSIAIILAMSLKLKSMGEDPIAIIKALKNESSASSEPE